MIISCCQSAPFCLDTVMAAHAVTGTWKSDGGVQRGGQSESIVAQAACQTCIDPAGAKTKINVSGPLGSGVRFFKFSSGFIIYFFFFKSKVRGNVCSEGSGEKEHTSQQHRGGEQAEDRAAVSRHRPQHTSQSQHKTPQAGYSQASESRQKPKKKERGGRQGDLRLRGRSDICTSSRRSTLDGKKRKKEKREGKKTRKIRPWISGSSVCFRQRQCFDQSCKS